MTNLTEIKRTLKEYYEYLHVSGFDEMNKSLERCRLPKLTQEEIDILREQVKRFTQ